MAIPRMSLHVHVVTKDYCDNSKRIDPLILVIAVTLYTTSSSPDTLGFENLGEYSMHGFNPSALLPHLHLSLSSLSPTPALSRSLPSSLSLSFLQSEMRSTAAGRMQWSAAFTGREGQKIVNAGRGKSTAKVSLVSPCASCY